MRIAGIGPVEMAEESLVAEDDILPADLGAEPIDTGDEMCIRDRVWSQSADGGPREANGGIKNGSDLGPKS